jgi:hypothetical protein
MPPVREILLVAPTHQDDHRMRHFGRPTGNPWETHCKRYAGFRYSHRNTRPRAASEAYDYSRDLAIEELFRFAARDTSPGTHAETQNVILVVNPTERERTEVADVEVDGPLRRVQS